MTIKEVVLYQRYRFWLGVDFIRTGIVTAINTPANEVYVEWDYDLPNEWLHVDKIC